VFTKLILEQTSNWEFRNPDLAVCPICQGCYRTERLVKGKSIRERTILDKGQWDALLGYKLRDHIFFAHFGIRNREWGGSKGLPQDEKHRFWSSLEYIRK
jgi:hypothetical protein